MADPFLGEIRIVPFNFAPQGWALCNGQILPISQNTALFSLLGTFYGGNGTTNYALPNLQGSVPMDAGQGPGLSQRFLGETGGETAVTLLASQLPSHSHTLEGAGATATTGTPSAAVALSIPPGSARHPNKLYKPGAVTALVTLDPSVIGPAGGGSAHNNMQPYLTLNFIIALQGVYPPRA